MYCMIGGVAKEYDIRTLSHWYSDVKSTQPILITEGPQDEF